MEWAKKGADALAAQDQAPSATAYYTKALIEHPSSPDYFTQRAVAFSRLKPPRHDLALRDTEYAILFAQKRAKREKIQAAQQRRVVALYGLGRYQDAKTLLDLMLRWRPKDSKKEKMEHDMWMAKVNGKLKDISNTDEQTLKEYPDITLPKEQVMKAWLKSQLKDGGTMDLEQALTIPSESNITPASETSSQAASSATVAPVSAPAVPNIRHDFYQNNDNLIITFYAKKVDPAKFNFELTSNSLSISFPNHGDQTVAYNYSATPTFAALDTENSKFKIYGTKIELTLAKQEKGVKWPSLQATDAPAPVGLPSPYVSKSKDNQDWDKRTAEILKKQPKANKPDGEADSSTTKADTADDYDSDEGGDVVDGFFKKLYKGADEDTRRAMMKSFQESNGTALSTNWADVSKGRVEEVKSKDDK